MEEPGHLLAGQGVAGRGHDTGGRDLAELVVGHAGDGGLCDVGAAVEHGFQVGGGRRLGSRRGRGGQCRGCRTIRGGTPPGWPAGCCSNRWSRFGPQIQISPRSRFSTSRPSGPGTSVITLSALNVEHQVLVGERGAFRPPGGAGGEQDQYRSPGRVPGSAGHPGAIGIAAAESTPVAGVEQPDPPALGASPPKPRGGRRALAQFSRRGPSAPVARETFHSALPEELSIR